MLAAQAILLGFEFGAQRDIEEFLGVDLFFQPGLGHAEFFLGLDGFGQILRRLCAGLTKRFQLGALRGGLFRGLGGDLGPQAPHLGAQTLDFRSRGIAHLAGLFEFCLALQQGRRHAFSSSSSSSAAAAAAAARSPAFGLVEALAQAGHFVVVPGQLGRLFAELVANGLQVIAELFVLPPGLGGFPGRGTRAQIEIERGQRTQACENQSNGLSHNSLRCTTFLRGQASTR